MKLKNLLLTLGLTAGLSGACLADDKDEKKADGKKVTAVATVKADNANCPVSGKAVDASQVSTYSKVVGFCCGKCKSTFEKDPGKHVDKVAKITATHINSKCPISGKAVDDSKTVDHNGQTVALCCGKCEKSFTADPGKYASKIVADNAGNDKCPISGKAVDAAQVAVYTKNVGLCCGKCKKKFDGDPDAMITKVK